MINTITKMATNIITNPDTRAITVKKMEVLPNTFPWLRSPFLEAEYDCTRENRTVILLYVHS